MCLALGRGFLITYESPKSESVGLFELGERAYDHLLVLPSKSKGKPARVCQRTTV